MKTGLFLTSLCTLNAATSAWTPASTSNAASTSRRGFLDQAALLVPLVAVAAPAFADEEVAAAAPAAESEAVAPAEPEPEAAPAPAADENEFIARLKAQSEANKDKYKAQSRMNDKLSKRQFASQYDRPSYVGVHTADNEAVKMVLKEQLDQLLADGKVKQTYESKVNKKSGEVSEDFSKPIFIFTN
mmetsp:Transcript_2741/g.7330  ORF Transcript_2741/g.7330 Transcript_2741/m.7330 type:complete len:187 (-) Transcript_2741:67-627(-)|eukprot:CAMPEP_0172366888 /NCGR_PEP_ID=MMETSP1060-20121228/17613_1 /TAXON_ID=37318 /ORGANISM="Pseudo-nitzschia pungens, Strain cf. cingulata" /LENGTH=186 /DNA_ID=CAMNT_0013090917 /DNA_START=1965 /DNA_END=2525 /DNA_ORIENTATION=-